MRMRQVPAVKMIGQAMRRFDFLVLGHPFRYLVQRLLSRSGTGVNRA
jgi:hypothetical protein